MLPHRLPTIYLSSFIRHRIRLCALAPLRETNSYQFLVKRRNLTAAAHPWDNDKCEPVRFLEDGAGPLIFAGPFSKFEKGAAYSNERRGKPRR
jgi:hypothetical protein